MNDSSGNLGAEGGSSAGGSWRRALASRVVLREGVPNAAALAEKLGEVVDPRAMANFAAAEPSATQATSPDIEPAIPDAVRRRHGVYFTPAALARQMAESIDEEARGRVVDLSCGDGALLEAAIAARPGLCVVGVERDPILAVAAAARVVRARGEAAKDRIVWGDGLAARPGLEEVSVVLGNPPYVGEKGNRELFAATRAAHPHLRRFFGPRIDLHYLFLHRALDLLRPDGQLIYLTSEYWLAATGAQTLRDDLLERSVVESFERLGQGVFDSAPGHHSLVFRARRRPTDLRSTFDDLVLGGPWAPFATAPRAEGTPLEELLDDHQGFVSGADRATKSVRKKLSTEVTPGAPVFLWRSEEVPSEERDLFRPLIRRSDCRANRVFTEPVGDELVLWADGTEDSETVQRLEVLLEPYREALEARREARNGTMPWYRIWWPRDPDDYARPKLVVPRRATQGAFCLDLSGSFVSSDCTYLNAGEDLDAVPSLLAAMLVLNDRSSIEHLRQYGKTKGEIIEFYSDPLRRLPLAVERHEGQLRPVDPALRQRWREGLQLLDRGDSNPVDV